MVSPFFSIIIPTYNSSNTILKSLESIYIQTFQNFEILIIDGLSTDRTQEIIYSSNYDLSKVRFIAERDCGVYDAMNKGISQATGKWIYFLGSDDYFYSNDILEQIFFYIKNYKCDVLYGNVLIEGTTYWAENNTIYDYEFDLKKLVKKNICHQSIFYKRDVIIGNSLKFNIKYSVCADWDFNLKLWSLAEFKYINIIIANFKVGGVSSNKEALDIFPSVIHTHFEEYFSIYDFITLSSYFGKPKILEYFLQKRRYTPSFIFFYILYQFQKIVKAFYAIKFI